MSDLFDFKEYTEELSLIINARQSKVSTKDLISYLANYEQLVKSINCALNSKYSFGYEMILYPSLFSDNSVITFSGKDKVDKLRLSNYSEEDILK